MKIKLRSQNSSGFSFYFLGLLVVLSIINFPVHSGKAAPTMGQKQFFGKAKPIPEALGRQMVGVSWKSGCPVALKNLRLLEMDYWDGEGRRHRGGLVVHQDVASELLDIFAQLFERKFPLVSMKPISEFGGSDARSMKVNNTSAFNCRPKTGQSKGYSIHSFGRAIDINPLWNPYVRKKKVLPIAGEQFAKRTPCKPGMLCVGTFPVELFKGKGWVWGGDWNSLKDYQHFEKP